MSRVVYATDAYRVLASDLCELGGHDAGELDQRRFPDGELYRRITDDPGGRDVVLVGGTISDEDTLEIYDLACGLIHEGARTLTLVVPYYGYATMERAVRAGEVVTAKVRARLLSSIPSASLGNRVLLCDLHSPGIEHYFEGHLRPTHISGKEVVLAAIRRLGRRLGGGAADLVVASTDAGRAKWVQRLAQDLGVAAGFVYKRRLGPDRTQVTGMGADVAERPVVIYDDMIRTGSSLLGAAAAYRAAGAVSVAAVATHGVFPGDSLDRIRASGLIDALVTTDTHPRARALAGDYLKVDSIAPVLSERLEEWP